MSVMHRALAAALSLALHTAHAANAANPYANIDPRVDAGNATGDEQIERLNGLQLGLSGRYRQDGWWQGGPTAAPPPGGWWARANPSPDDAQDSDPPIRSPSYAPPPAYYAPPGYAGPGGYGYGYAPPPYYPPPGYARLPPPPPSVTIY